MLLLRHDSLYILPILRFSQPLRFCKQISSCYYSMFHFCQGRQEYHFADDALCNQGSLLVPHSTGRTSYRLFCCKPSHCLVLRSEWGEEWNVSIPGRSSFIAWKGGGRGRGRGEKGSRREVGYLIPHLWSPSLAVN